MKQKVIKTVAIFIFMMASIGLAHVVMSPDSVVLAQPSVCEGLGGQDKDDCIKANTVEEGNKDEPQCDPSEENCCDGVKTSILTDSAICNDKDGVVFGLLKWILRLMTAGVGVAAVGGIGYGALLYTTAEGKPEQTKKGIEVITNVVIGIAAYALMFVLLNFLIPGGVFS